MSYNDYHLTNKFVSSSDNDEECHSAKNDDKKCKCPTEGCDGKGNSRNPKANKHRSQKSCPKSADGGSKRVAKSTTELT